MFDTKKIRQDFPILKRKINGNPLIYLDSTATSLKPQVVIDAFNTYMEKYSANIFRGIYTISEEATKAYEDVRGLVATFIHSPTPEQIIFTRNTTEALNLVAYSWLSPRLSRGDSVVTTTMEHHSNFVPWQQFALQKEAEFKILSTNSNEYLVLEDLDKLITQRTKLFAFTAVSNVLGTINPVRNIVKRVKKLNPSCIVVVDAAQAVPHMPIDVSDWDADFVAFSGHKMLGTTGFGVLWGKKERLEEMKPFLYGGEMIESVAEEKTTFKEFPYRFEAGTPAIAEVIAGGAAISYLQTLGMEHVRAHEKEITVYALKRFYELPFVTTYGPKMVEDKGGVIAFSVDGVHAHDVAQVLNEDNICIRSGHHCTMPLHTHLGMKTTARASFYIYTTQDEIDFLIQGLIKVKKKFG